MLKATLAAIVVSFIAANIAVAQTAPAQKDDSATPQTQASKRKAARHDHARDAKQGAAASTTVVTQEKKKKPLHDHRKEHKQ